MIPVALPLLIALLPLAALSVLQFALPVLAPLLTGHVNLAPTAYGWLGGAVGLGSVLFLLTSHVFMPAFGPVRMQAAGLAIAIGGILSLLTGQWPLMIFGALLIGYGYGTTAPAGSQVLADFTPRAIWGTLFSLRQSAVPIGGMAAGALGTIAAPIYGWQNALLLVLAAVAAALLALLMLPRRYNEGRPLKPFVASQLLDHRVFTRPAKIVRAVPGLPSLVAATWFLAWAHGVVTSFFVVYLVAAHGISLAKAALLFGILQGVAIVGRVVFGAAADRTGSPTKVLKLIAPLAALATLLLSLINGASPAWTLTAVTILAGMTVGTWNGLYLAEVARLAPINDVGDATAGAAVFGVTAYLLAPPAAATSISLLGYQATLQLRTLRTITATSLAAAVVGSCSSIRDESHSL